MTENLNSNDILKKMEKNEKEQAELRENINSDNKKLENLKIEEKFIRETINGLDKEYEEFAKKYNGLGAEFDKEYAKFARIDYRYDTFKWEEELVEKEKEIINRETQIKEQEKKVQEIAKNEGFKRVVTTDNKYVYNSKYSDDLKYEIGQLNNLRKEQEHDKNRYLFERYNINSRKEVILETDVKLKENVYNELSDIEKAKEARDEQKQKLEEIRNERLYNKKEMSNKLSEVSGEKGKLKKNQQEQIELNKQVQQREQNLNKLVDDEIDYMYEYDVSQVKEGMCNLGLPDDKLQEPTVTKSDVHSDKPITGKHAEGVVKKRNESKQKTSFWSRFSSN